MISDPLVVPCIIPFLNLYFNGYISAIVEKDFAQAWKNGDTPPHWRLYNESEHYGTHDWKTDFALEKVLTDPKMYPKWFDKDGNYFWTKPRKKIYLYATEGPDNGKISYTNRHNQKIWGENDKLHYHHVYFDIWGNTIDKKAAYKADIIARKAISAFKEGDCGLAAFYLGQMTHYFADVSQFYHVCKSGEIPRTYRDPITHCYIDLPNQYEECCLSRTDGRVFIHAQKKAKKWDVNSREWWFKVQKTPIHPKYFNPVWTVEALVIRTAWNTHFGDFEGYYYDAYEMNKTLINNNLYYCKKWWRTTETKMIQKGWRDHWLLGGSLRASKIHKFFKTLEYCLNFAIDCCAAAIDGVIDTVGEYQCKDLNTASESSKKVAGKLLGMIGLGMLMQIMSFLGSYAAVFAGVTIIKN